MISFLIPATIIIAAQLSMLIRYLTTRCVKYDPAPTREEHYQQPLVQTIKKFCKPNFTGSFLPSVDILITISYLTCYGPYFITTMANMLSDDDTLPLNPQQANTGEHINSLTGFKTVLDSIEPPLSLLILYNLHSTVNALLYGYVLFLLFFLI